MSTAEQERLKVLEREITRVFSGTDAELLALRHKVEGAIADWPLPLRTAVVSNIPVLENLSKRAATVDVAISRARVAADMLRVATSNGRYDADPAAQAELEDLAASWIRRPAMPRGQMSDELLTWLADRSELTNVDVTLPHDAAGAKAGTKPSAVYAERRQQIKAVK
jgi:hypothetical protein